LLLTILTHFVSVYFFLHFWVQAFYYIAIVPDGYSTFILLVLTSNYLYFFFFILLYILSYILVLWNVLILHNLSWHNIVLDLIVELSVKNHSLYLLQIIPFICLPILQVADFIWLYLINLRVESRLLNIVILYRLNLATWKDVRALLLLPEHVQILLLLEIDVDFLKVLVYKKRGLLLWHYYVATAKHYLDWLKIPLCIGSYSLLVLLLIHSIFYNLDWHYIFVYYIYNLISNYLYL